MVASGEEAFVALFEWGIGFDGGDAADGAGVVGVAFAGEDGFAVWGDEFEGELAAEIAAFIDERAARQARLSARSQPLP